MMAYSWDMAHKDWATSSAKGGEKRRKEEKKMGRRLTL